MKKIAAILLLLLMGSTLAFSQAAQKAGIFADGTYGDGWNGVPGTVTGLLYGNSTQIIAQMIGVAANVVYIGVISIIVYKAIDVVIGNRVSAAAEVEGLDIPEMGIPG